MNITKYEHACLSIEEQGSRIIIDPGAWSASLTDLSNIIGVVITHEHSDHLNKVLLAQIVGANPNVTIYTLASIADQLHNYQVVIPESGSTVLLAPFGLTFYQSPHQPIHQLVPTGQNLGVLVNDLFFYPGDAFINPYKMVDVLAVPAVAPWMKVGDAMDYIMTLKPRLVFPTHNGILSKEGNGVYNAHLELACQKAESTFRAVAVGESFTV